MVSLVSGAESALYAHAFLALFAASMPHFLGDFPSKVSQECAFRIGGEVWALSHVTGQPDFGC